MSFSTQLQKMKFKIFSTDIKISYSLLCVSAISIISGAFNGFLCCIIAILLHEAGHMLFMCMFGYKPDKINISLFEISISDKSRHQRTFFQNFLIIFFGPVANFICFILFYLLYLFSNEIFLPLAVANLSVGLFNLLPVLSLDGGQLLYILLCRCISDRTAEKVVDIVTFIFIFPLSALGFLLLFNSKYNFSLLFVCVYLVLSLICKNNRFY